jgi:hypothetical protein
LSKENLTLDMSKYDFKYVCQRKSWFYTCPNMTLNMFVIDGIIQCPRVRVNLQTNTGVSGNANTSIRFTGSTHPYSWTEIIPLYMRCCYNNKVKWLNRKVKNNKDNHDRRTNHLWGPSIPIQMQCQYLIKLLNKR